MWFRRDLRLSDHPALVEASKDGDVLPVFIFDPKQLAGNEAVSRTYLFRSVRALQEQLDGQLCVRIGNPLDVIPSLAREVQASAVHISADYGNYGRVRDEAVEQALGSTPLVRTGSPYAVAPGRILKGDGTPYRVYTPFYKAWLVHGWRKPAAKAKPSYVKLTPEAIPADDDLGTLQLPTAGEQAALARWKWFKANGLDEYADQRDRADLDGTSQLSGPLRFGEIHPRTLLADLGDERGHEVFRKEICWREFYADVLWNAPHTATDYLDERFARMQYDTGKKAEQRFEAWKQGRTGYPFVDAGMRQLLAEGWMHNRVRMVTASFLVKDLHLEWQQGAAWFAQWLRDFDMASNQHGWQWTAGCGTDAAPYFRIFNPVTQGLRFDPDGEYVRKYIPELAHLAGSQVHEPWEVLDGYQYDYPERIVDHSAERDESLRRYEAIKGQ